MVDNVTQRKQKPVPSPAFGVKQFRSKPVNHSLREAGSMPPPRWALESPSVPTNCKRTIWLIVPRVKRNGHLISQQLSNRGEQKCTDKMANDQFALYVYNSSTITYNTNEASV